MDGIDLRLPNITGATDRERLSQMQSYLYQLVEQLQWALSNVDTTTVVVTPTPQSLMPAVGGSSGTMLTGDGDDPQSTFNSIKALIIKSADIVEAYYEEINKRLESVYVAQSDFGDFAQKTSQEIEETSTSTTQRFENIQIIITNQGGELETVKGDLQTIGEDISYQQKDIITLNSAIETIDSYVATVEGEVFELDTSLQTAKTELHSKVENTKSELSGSINSTKTELSSTIISTKEELVGNINSVKDNLEGTIDSAKEELSGSIDNAKTELTGDINTAKSELAGNINSTKEELSGSIDKAKTDLSKTIDNTKTELSDSIDSAKTELSGKVDEVDEDLQTAKTATNERIDDTNESVGNLGVALNDANSRIADVDQDLQEAKETISENIQGVRESVTGVNALLEDAKATLRGSIDDLEVYVTGLQNVIIGVTAYLKSGLLYYTDAGIPVYGLEIGQAVKDEVSGEEVFNKYARFTSEKLSFYDNNGNEVAYISDKKLYIRIAEITVAFKIGGLMDLVMSNGDVVTKWVGG